jgi:putative oxidoreductase
MTPLRNFIALAGRILLAFIFVQSGIAKLGAIDATVANMTGHGIPLSNVLVWGAVVLEIGGGLLLMTGLFARCAALALAIYTLVLALLFHAYWLAPAAEARAQHASFFGHISMIGGMLYVVAFGAGGYSLDALRRRQSHG